MFVIVSALAGGCGRSSGSEGSLASADRAAAERAAAEGAVESEPASEPTTSPPASFSSETRERGNREGSFIKAADQAGDGSTVVIEEVVFAHGPGWVVIHSGPDIIGVSEQLPAGTSARVLVPLTRPLRFTEQVSAMLHTEDNQSSSFDFPVGDAPAVYERAIVAVPVLLQVS